MSELRINIDTELYVDFVEKCNENGLRLRKTCSMFLEDKIRKFLEEKNNE